MALTKLEDGGSNLTGAIASMRLLLSATISSAASEYDIDSTYINSTYDDYFVRFSFIPATNNVDLEFRVFVGGSIQTGNIYGFEIGAMSSSTYEGSNATDNGRFNVTNIGNASGEGITGHFHMHNINNTDLPFTMMGQSTQYNTSALPNANHFSSHLIPANKADVVNGIRFYFSSGDIASGSVKLYGIK
tara:strand:- start:56 stop:622 length:567 start_codon:yes stop_codon:yes gene_type:complete